MGGCFVMLLMHLFCLVQVGLMRNGRLLAEDKPQALIEKFTTTVRLLFCMARCSSVISGGSSDRSFMVDPLSHILFKTERHNWCNKGRGKCNPVCGMVHIKEPLLLIGKSSPCGDSRFPLSLSV